MKNHLKIILLSFLICTLVSCKKGLHAIPIDGDILMTINIKDQTITFLDIDEQTNIAEWNLNEQYTGGLLLQDNDSLLLYGKDVDTVDLFSLSEGRKIDSWSTGRGIVNGYLLENDTIAFADQYLNKVRFFSSNGNEIGNVITGKNPLTILQHKSKKDLLYVVNFDDKLLSIINIEDLRVERSISIHPNAAGSLIREEENEIWIGGHGERDTIEKNIHVYDLVSGNLFKKIKAPLMPIDFIEYENSIYALSHGSNTVYKYNTNGELEGSLKVAANPFDMTIFNGQLIIAGYDSNILNFIDLETFSISKEFNVGNGPFQIITRESM